MIHSSKFQPNIYPIGLGTPSSIARAQAIDPTVNTNFQRIKEIGRIDTVGYVRKIPSVSYRLTQTEYGSFNFWQQITNVSSATNTITLENFKTAAFDMAAFLTDDNGQYRGVMLYPYMRVEGFSLHIGNPDATAERTFTFKGEQAITFESPYGVGSVTPYYVEVDKTAGTASDDLIDLSKWIPVIDPDVPSGFSTAQKYIFRLALTQANVTYLLVPGVDYTYDTSLKKVTLTGTNYTVTAGDVYKTWFISGAIPDGTLTSGTTAVFPTSTFVQDNADAAGINATSVSIFLYVPGSGVPNSSDYLYRIQSCEIDVTFTREDLKEIGNRNIVQLGINLNKVNIKIGRILEKFTIDEVLRGVAPGYGKLDIENYGTNLSLIVKIYSDDTKQTLLYGMWADKLAPMDIGQGVPVNNYVKDNCTLDGEFLQISNINSGLDAAFTGPNPTFV